MYSNPYPEECSCGLNEFWEGYSHPDDDYFLTEIDQIIHSIIQGNTLPEAVFSNDDGNKTWTIGDEVEYELGGESNDDVWIV